MSETKTLHQRDVVVTELLLIAMAVIWGCNFTVNKYGTQVLEPLVYTSIRMAAGTLAMLGFATLGRSARATTAEKLKLTGLGLLGHGAYQLLFIYGISRTRAGTAALVIASSPAIIALVMRTFRDERLPPRALLGIALSILGIGVVMAGSAQEGHGGSSVIGDLMILGAVFCCLVLGLILALVFGGLLLGSVLHRQSNRDGLLVRLAGGLLGGNVLADGFVVCGFDQRHISNRPRRPRSCHQSWALRATSCQRSARLQRHPAQGLR